MIFRLFSNFGSLMILSTSVILTNTAITYAAMPENLYKEALQAAERKALRLKENRSGALSSSVLKALYGRYYRVGDSWDVISWQFNHSLTPLKRTRSSAELSNMDAQIGSVGIFHYEVTSLKNGISPTVTLQITPKVTGKFPSVDPRIEYLKIVMSDQFSQDEKTYYFQNRSEGVRVFSDGLRSNITAMELFPLDVPDVVTAERKTLSTSPELPSQIRSYAEKIGFSPDLNKSSWFEQDDFFGRPIQVLWQQGDPWPSYLKTSSGISLLIHKGNL